jgi:chromosome partitioning protein
MVKTVKSLQALESQQYKILLTKIPPPPSKEGLEAREILTEAGLPLMKAEIRTYSVYRKAPSQGLLVKNVPKDRKSKIAWNDYKTTFNELLEIKG